MISKKIIFPIILALSFLFLPATYAESTVSITMEKTTYTYCEKLFYTIEVSKVTGDPAIIHIRDETGKGSGAIPMAITNLQNPIPSLVPFEADVFPLGKYFIDVEYSGEQATAEFTLVDSNKVCIPESIKSIMGNWLSGNISDGFLIGAFQTYVDRQIIDIPFEIDENNVYDIDIPDWVKNVGYWWIQGSISDEDLGKVVNYLIEKKIISYPVEIGSGI
ncbi:MAG: hypothetical protein ACE5GR_08770 [Nitrosopumilus sp.]